MKPAARILASGGVLVIAAIAAFALLPYWHAAAMLLRAAGGNTTIARAARWDARNVTARVQTIATPEGAIRVRIFSPAGQPASAVLLVSGVHPDGIDEPR